MPQRSTKLFPKPLRSRGEPLVPFFVHLVKSNCRPILILLQLLQHPRWFGFAAANVHKPVVASCICHSENTCFSSKGADWSCQTQTGRKQFRLELFKSGCDTVNFKSQVPCKIMAIQLSIAFGSEHYWH